MSTSAGSRKRASNSALADEDPARDVAVGEQHRVAQEQVEQRVHLLLRREADREALVDDVVEGRRAQERDVVRGERLARLLARRASRAAPRSGRETSAGIRSKKRSWRDEAARPSPAAGARGSAFAWPWRCGLSWLAKTVVGAKNWLSNASRAE